MIREFQDEIARLKAQLSGLANGEMPDLEAEEEEVLLSHMACT